MGSGSRFHASTVCPLSPTHVPLSLTYMATLMSPLSPPGCHCPVPTVTPGNNSPSATLLSLPSSQVPPLCHHCLPSSVTALFLSPPQVPPPCSCCHPKCQHFVPLKCHYSVPAVTLNATTLSLLSLPKCHRPVPPTLLSATTLLLLSPFKCHHLVPAVITPSVASLSSLSPHKCLCSVPVVTLSATILSPLSLLHATTLLLQSPLEGHHSVLSVTP